MAKKTINGLPVFEAKMTSKNCGVLRVSFVDSPAVESDFLAYGSQAEHQMYQITDEEKRRVFGCVLRADYPIYRRDGGAGEYYIVFRADEIRAFAQKYLAEGRQNEVDLEHDFHSIEGAEMVQYFIKDKEKGINPAGYEDVADGSLFAEYQITDDSLWQRIKDGEFHGFSVEIIHAVLPAEFSSITRNMRNSVLAKVKDILAKAVSDMEAEINGEYKAVTTDKAVIFWDTEEDLKAGDSVWTEDAEGNRVELEDGEYVTEDGKIIVVAAGKVEEIRDKEAEVAPEAEPQPDAEAEEGSPEAVENAPVESEEVKALKDRIAELEAAIEAKDAEIADLKAKLDAPAGESAHDAYKKQAKDIYSATANPIAEAMTFLK